MKIETRSITYTLAPDTVKTFYWDKEYTIEKTANKLGVSFWKLYDFMNKYEISRRNSSEANYLSNRLKPQFKVKSNLFIEEEKLKIAGVMLYWAEGTLIGNTVDFVNSNPQMIKIFLKFLREICGIQDKRLRLYLYAYTYQNTEKLKRYWHRITRIPISQFTKPYIRKGNLNLTQRKLPYGLVHIRYNDKRLLELIRSWIDEYIKWAGT